MKLSIQTPQEAADEALRIERQIARAERAAAIEEALARPLRGDSSDVGQGRLFREDCDLFSGPSAEV